MSRFSRPAFLPAALLLASLAACGGNEEEAALVGGTLSGLPANANLVLQNNNANDLTLSTNGSFTLPGSVAAGSAYNITLARQPAGAGCVVANASGTINAAGNDVSNVTVACAPNASIVGTVTGLTAGTSVTLSNNNSSLLSISANGAFAFPGVLAAGTTYSVRVVTNPVGEICTLSNNVGTVVANTQTGIVVTCN